MKIFGLEITRAKTKSLSAVDSGRGGWWPIIRESFAGAFQQNVEIVTADVMAYPAVFSCITLIASDISKLRIKLMRFTESEVWSEERNNSAYSSVLRKPNDFQTRQQFLESWIISKLAQGNAYILKERDRSNKVRKLYVLDPTLVVPLVSSTGDVFYRIQRDDLSGVNSQVVVPASEIIHDRFNCLYHPLVGISPIYANGLAATQGNKIQRNSASFFGNASRPSGILTTPDAIDDETAAELKTFWQENFSGENAGNVAVLGDGLKFEQMGISAQDSQLVEQLGWTVEIVCSTYHVPPYKIGHGPLPSYTNIQSLNLEYYVSALQGLIEAVEACLDDGLGLDGVSVGTELDVDNLLRMDSVTQMEILKTGVSAAVYSPNEARQRVGLLPKTGGDTPYLQQQNFSLEALAKRDASENPFATTSNTNNNNSNTNRDDNPPAPANENEELVTEAQAALITMLKGFR